MRAVWIRGYPKSPFAFTFGRRNFFSSACVAPPGLVEPLNITIVEAPKSLVFCCHKTSTQPVLRPGLLLNGLARLAIKHSAQNRQRRTHSLMHGQGTGVHAKGLTGWNHVFSEKAFFFHLGLSQSFFNCLSSRSWTDWDHCTSSSRILQRVAPWLRQYGNSLIYSNIVYDLSASFWTSRTVPLFKRITWSTFGRLWHLDLSNPLRITILLLPLATW